MTSFLTVVSPAEMSQHVADAGTTTGGTDSGGSGRATARSRSRRPERELTYDVTELSANAGKVTIAMANPSPLPHNVAIKGNGIDDKGPVVFKGGTSTVSADLQPARTPSTAPCRATRPPG